MDNPSINPETFRKKYAELSETSRQLEGALQEAQTRLKEHGVKIKAFELVAAECAAGENPSGSGPADRRSLKDAIIDLAESNDGVFDTYRHKKTLVGRGLISEGRSASQAIYQALEGSGKFERGGKKGKWILIHKSPVSDLESILG